MQPMQGLRNRAQQASNVVFGWLKGDRAGRHSIRINDQWRICFRFVNGDAFEVEITDYH